MVEEVADGGSAGCHTGAGGGGGDLWPVVVLGSVFFPFCANITYTQEELLLLEEEAKPSNVKHGKKLKSQSKFSLLLLPSLY